MCNFDAKNKVLTQRQYCFPHMAAADSTNINYHFDGMYKKRIFC